ncbi:hypothetical protein SUGI_0467360 [Cryptomeria japonica]|nr:hypothetical protein SUGI_0467360 [Cryptomeria japonica]
MSVVGEDRRAPLARRVRPCDARRGHTIHLRGDIPRLGGNIPDPRGDIPRLGGNFPDPRGDIPDSDHNYDGTCVDYVAWAT